MGALSRWLGVASVFLLTLNSGCDEFPFFGGDDGDDNQASARVGPTGGRVTLSGVAEAEFPAGAFASPTRVVVERRESAEMHSLFVETSEIFGVGDAVSYQVAVSTGSARPQADSFTVALSVPRDFASRVPVNHGLEVFVLLKQTSEAGEEIDNWELVFSDYDAQAGTLKVRVPSFVLSPYFSTDGSNEILLTVASTPGTRQAKPSLVRFAFSAPGTCATSTGPPLDQMILQEGYGELRKDPTKGYKLHWGADLTAPVGTPVRAALTGTVEFVGVKNGYGNTIILKHGASRTLYAHLSAMDVKKDAPVTEGQVIGKTGTTGNAGGTKPHLHFEIAPNGDIMQQKNKADPYGCVATTASGDIRLSDNGNIADDAFVLSIDGVELLRTTPGGAASRQTGPLRLGAHVLKLFCELAPDDVGTYEILLSGRTVFKTGDQRRRSSTLRQGESFQDSIVVFGTDQTNPTTVRSIPNAVREGPR